MCASAAMLCTILEEMTRYLRVDWNSWNEATSGFLNSTSAWVYAGEVRQGASDLGNRTGMRNLYPQGSK